MRQFSHQGGPLSNIPRWPRRSRASQPVYLGQYKPAALFATLKKARVNSPHGSERKVMRTRCQCAVEAQQCPWSKS